MRRRNTLKSVTAAILLSPLAATCSPPGTMLAEAHQEVRQGTEDRLVSFLIDGEVQPIRR